MAKNLRVTTDRSPALKIGLSATDGGEALAVTTALQINVHVIPEGYKDEIYMWWVTNDAAADGAVLVRLGDGAANEFIVKTPFRTISQILDGHVVEARTADRAIQLLAITEPGHVFGYVIRVPITV